MKVSMNAQGQVIASGEGSYRAPQAITERDVSLTSPVAQAQKMRADQQREAQQQALREKQRNAELKAQLKYEQRQRKEAREQESIMREVEARETAGEHPLLYLAAYQSMAGHGDSFNCGISGHGLSVDGVPAFDRAMGIQAGMGDFWSDLSATAQNIQSTVQSALSVAQPLVKMVSGPSPAEIEAARAKAEAEARAQAMALALAQSHAAIPASTTIITSGARPGASAWQQLMATKIGPVPAPVLLAGVAALGALLILRKPARAA